MKAHVIVESLMMMMMVLRITAEDLMRVNEERERVTDGEEEERAACVYVFVVLGSKCGKEEEEEGRTRSCEHALVV